MKLFAWLLICILYYSCGSALASVRKSNRIDLSDAIRHKQAVKLSSLADSVTFIPLETREKIYTKR